MAAPMEVAVCTDSSAQLWSCVVWELHSGANLLTYRGGQAGPRGLALLNGEYLLAAQLGKNYISAWELQRKDQLQQKIMCPGPVTCLTTSPNGLYVLAGIAESIYLWEVSTGNLLVILSRHYQDVSCLQFTGDSSHFLSGGKDCLVLVWSLCSVLQADLSRTPCPRHVWSRHTLPITDLHCGFGGPLARVATASLDQTVKLWEVSSGELLLSVLFDVGVVAVTMDLAEHHMFCGGSDGSIFQVDLCTWSCIPLRNVTPRRASGDGFGALISPSMNRRQGGAALAIGASERRGGLHSLTRPLPLQGTEPSYLERAERLHAVLCSTMEKSVLGGQDQLRIRVTELEDEVQNLRKINRDLFDFSTHIITRPSK
ncbi:LOW QUALITY PROTEIN: WD repeat-containing protein 18 [Pteropus vampyrus]|uniref:WD repeat-containing protein 18 n=1 Tax=Pteropus vampyrus TaxID=132908 RepID=A0A6P6BMD2_PTEVA|nr:LOW QUALITY PROTEIN: WD repeat-containing protein 18 [Pteropus vampyrus]